MKRLTFLYINLDIPCFTLNHSLAIFFVLVLENLDMKGNCHGQTFMLDETQISRCIKKVYYYEKYFFFILSDI